MRNELHATRKFHLRKNTVEMRPFSIDNTSPASSVVPKSMIRLEWIASITRERGPCEPSSSVFASFRLLRGDVLYTQVRDIRLPSGTSCRTVLRNRNFNVYSTVFNERCRFRTATSISNSYILISLVHS